MYFYRLAEYEGSVIIQNEKKYSKKKFQKICKEAPLGGSDNFKYYSTPNIIKYLKKKYGFEELKTVAGFFVDDDIENETEGDE